MSPHDELKVIEASLTQLQEATKTGLEDEFSLMRVLAHTSAIETALQSLAGWLMAQAAIERMKV